MEPIEQACQEFIKYKSGLKAEAKKNYSYKRFAIVREARSGSTFLSDLLQSHSSIETFGELFNVNSKVMEEYVPRILSDPLDYYKEIMHAEQPEEINAIGFTICYPVHKHRILKPTVRPRMNDKIKERITNVQKYINENINLDEAMEKSNDLWEHIESDLNLKIILLKRENILKRYLSFMRARINDSWALAKDLRPDLKPIRLEYNHCIFYFKEAEKYEKHCDNFFKNHQVLQLEYEFLVKNPKIVLGKIQDFLGLEHQEMKTIYRKQNIYSLSEAISNYAELKDKCKDTKWIKFFND